MIGSNAAVTLAESLRVNKGLHYLILNENTLYDEGAIAIAEALRDNKSLHSLELKDNCLSQEVLHPHLTLPTPPHLTHYRHPAGCDGVGRDVEEQHNAQRLGYILESVRVGCRNRPDESRHGAARDRSYLEIARCCF